VIKQLDELRARTARLTAERDGLSQPKFLAGLMARSDEDVRGIAGGNILRVMRGAEAAAKRIQAERAPSEATIEELDG